MSQKDYLQGRQILCFLLSAALLSSIISAEAHLLNFIHEKNTNLICLSKILMKYSEKHTLVISSEDVKINSTKVLYTEDAFVSTTVFTKFNMFVFSLKTTKKFYQILLYLYGSNYWNSRAKYLFLFDGDPKELNDIFNVAWGNYIFDITAIAAANNSSNLYTFYPYGGESCGEFNHYELISSCDSIVEVFPAKIPLDLHGCQIKLMPFVIAPYVTNFNAPRDDPSLAGLEVTIAHAIAEKMNFTEVYVKNPHIHWGYKYNDGSYTMMFWELHQRTVDVIFGYILGNSSYIFDFDLSFCHLADKSVWWFPTALQMAQWKNLTCIFEGRLWLMILLMFLINGTFWWINGRKRETSDEFNDLTLCIMNSLYTLLQGSVKPPQRGNVRIIFILWLLSCLLIFTAHQCQLISILTNPLYDKQMETLEELVTSDSSFGFYPIVADAYVNDSNWISKAIFTRYETCPLTAECLNRTAFRRDFAVVKNVRQVRYLTPRIYTYPNGRPMLFLTEEVAFHNLIRYHAVKGFPLLERFDRILMLLEENGLIKKWDVDSTFKVIKVESEPTHEPLSLGHLQGAFFVWIIGMFVSFTVLIFEKIAGYFYCCKPNKSSKYFSIINIHFRR